MARIAPIRVLCIPRFLLRVWEPRRKHGYQIPTWCVSAIWFSGFNVAFVERTKESSLSTGQSMIGVVCWIHDDEGVVVMYSASIFSVLLVISLVSSFVSPTLWGISNVTGLTFWSLILLVGVQKEYITATAGMIPFLYLDRMVLRLLRGRVFYPSFLFLKSLAASILVVVMSLDILSYVIRRRSSLYTTICWEP